VGDREVGGDHVLSLDYAVESKDRQTNHPDSDIPTTIHCPRSLFHFPPSKILIGTARKPIFLILIFCRYSHEMSTRTVNRSEQVAGLAATYL
jgi:hypothetical protein